MSTTYVAKRKGATKSPAPLRRLRAKKARRLGFFCPESAAPGCPVDCPDSAFSFCAQSASASSTSCLAVVSCAKATAASDCNAFWTFANARCQLARMMSVLPTNPPKTLQGEPPTAHAPNKPQSRANSGKAASLILIFIVIIARLLVAIFWVICEFAKLFLLMFIGFIDIQNRCSNTKKDTYPQQP